MAFIDVPGQPIRWPASEGSPNAPGIQTQTLDAESETVAFIFQCPRDGVLNRVAFGLGTVTQAPSNGLVVSFQDVNENGLPDGTVDQSRVVTSGISSNAWIETGLITDDGTDDGTKRTVSQGDLIAVVVGFESFESSDELIVQGNYIGPWSHAGMRFPYNRHSGGIVRNGANILLEYETEGYIAVPGATGTGALSNISSLGPATSPDEVGIKFQVPWPVKVKGLYSSINHAFATRAGTYFLYDENDTELASKAWDASYATGPSTTNYATIYFSEEIELSADTTYRLTYLATTLPNQIVTRHSLGDGSSSKFLPGTWIGDSDIQGTERTDEGAWTDSAFVVPCMGLLISSIDPVKSVIPSAGDVRQAFAAVLGGRIQRGR